MNINISYGEKEITVDVPDDKVNGVLSLNEVEKKDEQELLKKALNRPIDSPSFDEFIGDNTLFIVNDATRPTPTAKVLDIIKDKIEEHDVKFIVATGSHREPTEEEYKWIFGDLLETHRENIHCHDADKSEMKYYGETDRGTPVRLNKMVDGADKIVAINTVEPHYFAGFTGGRKSFLPGVASYETIEKNHYHSLKEGTQMLKLDGNPVHEDMIEAYRMVDKPVFSINMSLDKDGDIYHASCGEMEQVFINETKKAEQVFTVPLEERSEVVVTIAHPMDIDLYQSQKSLETGKLALKEGGTLILVSECRDGIGPDNFYNLMASFDTPQEVLDKIREGYKLGYHKAAKIINICSSSDISAVTELENDKLENIFFTPGKDIKKMIDQALEEKGGKVTFLLEGALVVPKVTG